MSRPGPQAALFGTWTPPRVGSLRSPDIQPRLVESTCPRSSPAHGAGAHLRAGVGPWRHQAKEGGVNTPLSQLPGDLGSETDSPHIEAAQTWPAQAARRPPPQTEQALTRPHLTLSLPPRLRGDARMASQLLGTLEVSPAFLALGLLISAHTWVPGDGLTHPSCREGNGGLAGPGQQGGECPSPALVHSRRPPAAGPPTPAREKVGPGGGRFPRVWETQPPTPHCPPVNPQ